MSKYKDMAMAKASDLKGGMSNIKGGVKGKVNGVLGRKSNNDYAPADHVARPISSLRDPDSFAPPPRRTTTGLSEPPPPRETAPRKVLMAPSKYQDPRGPKVEPPPKISSSRQLLEAPYAQEEAGFDGDDEPRPYRMDTTGLSTGHLPSPPTRRDGANERSPPTYDSPMSARRVPPQASHAAPAPAPAQAPSAAPRLPPRLPPRSNSSGPETVLGALPKPSTLNQGAVSRLGAAGISVPALGIGSSRTAKASTTASTTTTTSTYEEDEDDPAPPRPPRPMASQPNLLQNRMFKAAANSASSFSSSAENVAAPAPAEGTSWAQKQAALKTASAFHKDPASVSFADARAAASTANNFRQRHGHQVAAGLAAASDINQRCGVADRVGALASQQQHHSPGAHSPSSSTTSLASAATAVSALAGKKKPPPPPPPAKKKPGLAGPPQNVGAQNDAPPPVPFATRPTF